MISLHLTINQVVIYCYLRDKGTSSFPTITIDNMMDAKRVVSVLSRTVLSGTTRLKALKANLLRVIVFVSG